MTVSPFDHPYLSGLVCDEEAASFFSVAAELEAMLAFEVALCPGDQPSGQISRYQDERKEGCDAAHLVLC